MAAKWIKRVLAAAVAAAVDAGEALALPTADTLWTAETQGPLTPSSPVTLSYDNGKGLKFTRTIR